MLADVGEAANQVERWYGAHYHQQATPDATNTFWSSSFAEPLNLNEAPLFLPPPNRYIAYSLLSGVYADYVCLIISQLSLLDTSTRVKESLSCAPHDAVRSPYRNLPEALLPSPYSDGCLLWSADKLFFHPRSVFFILIKPNHLVEFNCRAAQMNNLTTRVFSRLMATRRYAPSLAGLHTSAHWTSRYISPSIDCL
jgi:hypothetical protein